MNFSLSSTLSILAGFLLANMSAADIALVRGATTIAKNIVSRGIHDSQPRGVTVSHVTDENFDSFLSQHELVLVNFCSKRSGICKFLDVEINEFAEVAEQQGLSFGIAKVDCVDNKQLCSEQDVHAYPTMRWYHNTVGNKETFHGLMITGELMELAHRETGNAPAEIAVGSDAEMYAQHSDARQYQASGFQPEPIAFTNLLRLH